MTTPSSPWLIGYLAGFFAAVGVAVGALGLLMIARLSGARWIAPFRTRTEAIASSLPYFLLLFLPVAVATRSAPLFLARSYFYLVVWSAFSLAWRRSKSGAVSGVGVPVLILTISFAGFDWMMRLAPGWVSDAFGFYVATSAFAGAVGMVAVLAAVAPRPVNSARSAIEPAHTHALGSVLLTAVILWAYIAFCQFLIIWIGDLPSEISFYADRSVGAWRWMALCAVLTQFVIPFLLLLSHDLKRYKGRLAVVGACVVAGHFLDTVWVALPAAGGTLRVGSFSLALAVFAAFVAFTLRPRGAT